MVYRKFYKQNGKFVVKMTQTNYVKLGKQVEFQETYATGGGINERKAREVAFINSGMTETPRGAEYHVQANPVGGFIATFGTRQKH